MEKFTASKSYSYETMLDTDPILAFAGLRIELERKLREIAHYKNIELPRTGITGLIRELKHHNVLNENEAVVLRDLTSILNRAAHGQTIEPAASGWVKAISKGVLGELNLKLSKTDNL